MINNTKILTKDNKRCKCDLEVSNVRFAVERRLTFELFTGGNLTMDNVLSLDA